MTPFVSSLYSKLMEDISPNQVYTTKESRDFLRVSERTVKRWLKKRIIRANKIGGRYRILGRELLRLVSPEAEKKAESLYYRLKEKTRKAIEKW